MTRWTHLFLLASLVPALAPSSGMADAVDELPPGHWLEIPDSRLVQVAADPAGLNLSGRLERGLIAAWSGGVVDSTRGRLLVWGGGHDDYGGNEVYAFDLHTLSWSRLTDPTANPNRCGSENSDGTPVSRHTYGGLAYIEHADRLFAFGGALDCGSPPERENVTWTLNLATLRWERRDPGGDIPWGVRFGIESDYDPMTRRVFLRDRQQISSYDFDANTWTEHAQSETGGWYGDDTTAAIDPVGRRMVIVGGGNLGDFDLATLEYEDLTASGDTEIVGADAPGLAYDPIGGQLVAWSGEPGRGMTPEDVYSLDASTWTWTRRPPAPDNTVVPSSLSAQGTFGRFRFVPTRNVFVLVNNVEENVFVYRMTEGDPLPRSDGGVPDEPDGSVPMEPDGEVPRDAGTTGRDGSPDAPSPPMRSGVDSGGCSVGGATVSLGDAACVVLLAVVGWRKRRRFS
ncbi:MAG: hypothetical protein AAGF12_10070 [Myxococcota bacterium]